MKFLIPIFFCAFILACSSSKTKNPSVQKNSVSSSSVINLKDAPPGKIDTSEVISKKAIEVIKKHTKYATKDIARSQIIKTKNGYWWKFVNVRYGQKFIVTTDASFTNVQLIKQSKE